MSIVSSEWSQCLRDDQFLFSEKVTCSDEAFALWVLTLNKNKLCKDTSLDMESEMSEVGETKCYQKKGKNGSHDLLHEMELYQRLYNAVQLKRRCNEAHRWDLEFMLYWKKLREFNNRNRAVAKLTRPEIPMDEWDLMPYPASWEKV